MSTSVLFLFIVLTLSACNPENTENTNKTTPSRSTINTITPAKGVSQYSLTYKEKVLNLRDWDSNINLGQILGRPLKQSIRVLGEGADTHRGSVIKTLSYNGLTIELFSPRPDVQRFWILSMETSSRIYSTGNGIKAGSTVKEIETAYPTIQIALDGRTDSSNCAYILSEDNNNLRIEVVNGIAKLIRIYYEIP
ncbi:hypothetical protein ACFSJU_13455 [Paradesertivirga mongoliensis]|uniref:Lipoprotein n=1 Tax=Paradesertivirga mongoliensis TaxID=2100740 RepID=A0ABW4ZMS1_9SPHI|nr:hypothetical protein [Pedobacter mongoliensis]